MTWDIRAFAFDTCFCCGINLAWDPYLCESCLEHVQREYALGYSLPSCPVYDAWCYCEPYSWEVAS